MKKRLFAFILSLLMMLTMVVTAPSVTAYAAGASAVNIEQIHGVLPQTDVYVYFEDVLGNVAKAGDLLEDVTVQRDAEALEVLEVLEGKDFPTTYYILLDVSTNMPMNIFNNAKKEILDLYKEKNSDDKIVLITFAAEVTMVLEGDENLNKVEDKLDDLRRQGVRTRLLDAVNMALNIKNKERSVIVAITYGKDYYKSGPTEEEVITNLVKAKMPFFAMGVDGADKEYLDPLGELARTGGGFMQRITANTIGDAFDTVSERVNSTYLIRTQAKNNIVPKGSTKITVIAGADYTDSAETVFSAYVKDNTVPTIKSVDITESTIIVKFSEAVDNAGTVNAYTVRRKDGMEIPIASVKYNSENNEAELSLAKNASNGTYIISANGITDVSMEKNKVQNSFTVEVTNLDSDFLVFVKSNVLTIAIGVAVVLILIVVVVSALHHRKKSGTNAGTVASDSGNGATPSGGVINSVEGKNVTLVYSDVNGISKEETVLVREDRTIIIGRQNSCDVVIPDKCISRKNVELCYRNGQIYALDLSRTNGALLNGYQFSRNQIVNNRDVLSIGNTKITIKL